MAAGLSVRLAHQEQAVCSPHNWTLFSMLAKRLAGKARPYTRAVAMARLRIGIASGRTQFHRLRSIKALVDFHKNGFINFPFDDPRWRT